MAASQYLSELAALNDALIELESFAGTCSALTVDQVSPPPWVFVLACQVQRAMAASEALERSVRQDLLPLVESHHAAAR